MKVIRLSRRVRWLLLAAALLFAALCVIDATGFGRDVMLVAAPADQPDGAAFLARYGWQTDPASRVADRVTLPAAGLPVFERYQALQLAQGLDLAPYAGRAVTRYTYRVLNHPAGQGVLAHVLVADGRVIGADICSAALAGFMQGVSPQSDGPAAPFTPPLAP